MTKVIRETKFYVYILFRLDGSPCYIGKGFGDRWTWHERHPNHHNKNLLRLVAQAKRVGKELPKVKLHQELTEEQAFALEKLFIKTIGRKVNGGPLVNLTDGGDGESGKVYTAEQIERFRVAAKRRKPPSAETKAKISAALKGRPKSPEHIAAAAASQRGKPKRSGWWSTKEGRAKQRANNPGNSGHPQSTLAKRQISNKLLGRHTSLSTEFKPGNQPTAATRKRLRKAAKAFWARRKAK